MMIRLVVICSVFIIPLIQALLHPEDLVNILGGSDSAIDLSRGSTLPFITLPWAFNGYAPQTNNDGNGWWFHPHDHRFYGMRVSHQPSPWINDYGNFLIQAGIPNPEGGGFEYSGYSSKQSVFSPYYFKTDLESYGTEDSVTSFELTPSNHGGIIRVKFPKYLPSSKNGDGDDYFLQTRRISIILHGNKDFSQVNTDKNDDSSSSTTTIAGYTTENSGGVGSADAAFKHYFVAMIYGGANGNVPTMKNIGHHADSSGAWVDFDAMQEDHEVLTVRFATSFISLEQALFNLQSEVGVKTTSFDRLKEDAKEAWRKTLSRIDVSLHEDSSASVDDFSFSAQEENKENEENEGNSKEITDGQAKDKYSLFYTALYRASLFPRQLTEISAEDGVSEIHWSPYADSPQNRVRNGPLSTDSGFWDAWNTVYPLLTLFNRPVLGLTMKGWLNAFEEGGWLPKWASPGYRGSMVGTMGDVSLADAIVNDIPGFDKELAYRAIRKDAFEVPPKGVEGVGRPCLTDYLKLGYIPRGGSSTDSAVCSEVVSRTLNYYHSDYAISRAALKLGYIKDAAVLSTRASNYSLIFDSDTGFFRSRSLNETWSKPFNQYTWGGDYTEGGPWQFRFYVPFDPKGLANLYQTSKKGSGEPGSMCREILHGLTSRPTFHVGSYGNEIHEEAEMVENCGENFGQYSHNNQPVHHMLYMMMHEGYGSSCAQQGQGYVRKVLSTLYSNTLDMFPGDEDNGEMSAWFVLSSIGLYNLSPGSGEFMLTSPAFPYVKIDISDDGDEEKEKKYLTIMTRNSDGGKNVYVKHVYWNDQLLPASTASMSYASISQGGVLVFELAAEAREL